MRTRLPVLVLALFIWSAAGTAQQSPLVETVGDTGFLQLQAPSFAQLTPPQQQLAYWLTQASIAIDPIVYDQLSSYGIRLKRLLEGIVAQRPTLPAGLYAKVRDYALLVWANRGNHNELTSLKFVPSFTPMELMDAAVKAQAAGAFRTAYADLPALPDADALRREVTELQR